MSKNETDTYTLITQLTEATNFAENVTIYVDMDGVIADFEAGTSRVLKDRYNDAHYEADPKYRNMMWNIIAKYQEEGNEFWYDLPIMQDAHKLLSYVNKYNPQILSATGNPHYNAEEQKRRWIKEHIGDIKVNIVRKAVDKAQYVCPTCVLIDDKMKAIGPWRAAGGVGILHTDANTTIGELRKLGL